MRDKIVDAALFVGKQMAPPKEGAHPEAERRWRWVIVAVVTGNTVALAAHIALACGLTPFYSGFAYAEDVQAVKSESRSARLEQLQWTMFELRTRQCEAIAKGLSPRGFTIQLEAQQKLYQSLTDSYHQLPSCDELK